MKKWKEKQTVVQPYHGLLHARKKEWRPDTRYNMNKSQNNYAKWKKPDRK